jgi:hypothetical protein
MDIELVQKARRTILKTRTLLEKHQVIHRASEQIVNESRELILKASVTIAKAEKTPSLVDSLLRPRR